MAPDFPYIVGTTEYRDIGHFWSTALYFTLPLSLIILWVFHNYFKRPVIGLLPWGMQARLQAQADEFRFGGVRHFLAIVISTLLGIASHLVWDSFTHSSTWACREFPWLSKRVHLFFVDNVAVYSLAQYGSTVLGLLALALWVWLWYRRSQPAVQPVPRSQSRFPLALAMFALAGIVGLCRAVLFVGGAVTRGNAHLFLLIFGVTSLALAFWQLILYCVLVSTHQVW
jgi:hypothetical protein